MRSRRSRVSFSWFASAYDTDDWLFRIMTMVQMVGVLLLALGLPIVMACAGVALPWCLAVLALAPSVAVVGYELVGDAHNARILDELTE